MPSDRSQSESEYEAPFAALLDLRRVPGSDGVGRALMTIQDKHRQSSGMVQGGILVMLADYAFHLAVQSVLPPGHNAVTLELKVNFIAPARDGELTATARLVSTGRRIVVGEVDVTDQGQTLIARCLGTFLVTAPAT